MGDLVTLTIFKDNLHQIKNNPQGFVEELAEAVNGRKSKTILGQTVVQARRDSKFPAVYVQMENGLYLMDPYSAETRDFILSNRKSFEEMLRYVEKTARELRTADALRFI